ncbi:MAG: hypothetical protein QOE90_212 [Thermoplasmata archaeon]|jgi:hypothetical protein|nr:hypothetical protein [Thermoplasmata archaeon]
MSLAGIVPLVAGVLAAAFAAMVWGQFSARRRPYQLAWALGLTAYSAASFIEAYVGSAPWSVALFRVYFPLAAATVGLLGLGSVLLARVNLGTALYAALTGLAVLVALMGPFALSLSPDTTVKLADGTVTTLRDAGPALGAAPVPLPNPGRVAFLLLNVVGGLALIGGALWSWWRTRRLGVLLIGVGAILPFTGGSLSDLLHLDVRVALQAVGIVVMFVGYLQGRETPRAA